MSWLDELITQIGEASIDGGSPADALPSEAATADTFVPGKDSADASNYFETFFKGEAPDTRSMGASGPEYGSAAQDSQRANEALGLSADTRMPSVAGYGQQKADPSFLEALLGRTGLKKTKDGETDWSDPATMNAAMRLIGLGANLTGMLMRKGQPEGYKSAAQLRAEIAGPNNNWNPQQQATANAFFSKPLQGAAGHAMQYASTMPSPIVPGKGYADGGLIPGHDYSAGDVSSWLGGTNGQGISGSQWLSDLERASYANTGGYLSAGDFTKYGDAIGAGQTPEQIAAGLGWSKPAPSWDALYAMDHPAPAKTGFVYQHDGAPAGPGVHPRDARVGAGGVTMEQIRSAQRNPSGTTGALAQYVGTGGGRGGQSTRMNMGAAMRDLFQNNAGQSRRPQTVRPSGPSPQPGLPPQSAPTGTAPAGAPAGLSSVIVPFSSSSPSASAYGMRGGGRVGGYARGGALGYIQANSGGQDDVVPIRAAGGEYMFDADTVSALGDGNNAAGAKKLDAMRQNIRQHKRSAPKNKIPPRAHAPQQYMKGSK